MCVNSFLYNLLWTLDISSGSRNLISTDTVQCDASAKPKEIHRYKVFTHYINSNYRLIFRIQIPKISSMTFYCMQVLYFVQNTLYPTQNVELVYNCTSIHVSHIGVYVTLIKNNLCLFLYCTRAIVKE